MKYELVREDMVVAGVHSLYRIRALRSIESAGVQKGDLGGYIQSVRNLSQDEDCWVSDSALVFVGARILNNAIISGFARVYGGAVVYDNATVWGFAQVYGITVHVRGNSQVFENAQVYDGARIRGNSRIYGNAQVYEDAQINDNVQVFGNARVHGEAFLEGNTIIFGEMNVGGIEPSVDFDEMEPDD